MPRPIRLTLALALCLGAAPVLAKPPARLALLRHYQGKEPFPPALLAAYEGLVLALERGDPGEINKHCLPQAVSLSTAPRPAKTREYGTDVNLPFIKQGFDRHVRSLRRDALDVYLVRTGSSYLFFVEGKQSGWKLYRYGDKPIE